MRKVFLCIIPLLLLGCETNPPTAPPSLKSGEVQIQVTFTEDNNISSQRTVLLEDFANVSCTPCLTSNKIIRSVLNSYGSDEVVSIKFPTNFPSPVDPMYLSAKEFCDYRMSLYNILFAPTIILDGVVRPTPTDSNKVKSDLNNRLAVESNFKIDVTKTIITGGLLVEVDIKVKNKNTLNLDQMFLRFAIVESEVIYDQAPGSNGETEFYDVLRTLYPSNEGVAISLLGPSQTFHYENALDTLWNINHLEVVSFIQSSANREVLQTGSSFN